MRNPRGIHYCCQVAAGFSLLRSGRSSTASRCRSRSAGSLIPTEALTSLALMMQPILHTKDRKGLDKISSLAG